MNEKINKKDKSMFFVIALFFVLSVWWALLTFMNPSSESPWLFFGASYGLMALFGGLYGLTMAKKWGSFGSALGRTILFLSLGLLLSEFGQIVFSYYNIIKDIDIPYPSLADVGFFGSIPLYILAVFSLFKLTSAGQTIQKSPSKLIIGILLPLSVLLISYSFFLKNYDFTEKSNLTVFLDFGYPLGQAIYVSLALVTLLSVSAVLGGVLRKPLLLLFLALVLQYTADFNFLYQTIHETWKNGGYGDYLYLLAYFTMTIALIKIGNIARQLTSRTASG